MAIFRATLLFVLVVLAGCATPAETSPVQRSWTEDRALAGGHGTWVARVPLAGQEPLRVGYSLQLGGGAADFVPETYFVSIFLEGEAAPGVPPRREVWAQNLGGLLGAQGPTDVILRAQGEDVMDTRKNLSSGAVFTGAHTVTDLPQTLVLAVAFVTQSGAASFEPRLVVNVTATGTGAALGPVRVDESGQAGRLNSEEPGDYQAQACGSVAFTWACTARIETSFTTKAESLVYWWLKVGNAGAASARLEGSSSGLVAACESAPGEDVQWDQAVRRAGETWQVSATVAGTGALTSIPRFYLFWADVPAVLKDEHDTAC